MSNSTQEYDKKKEQLKEEAKEMKDSIAGHLSDAGNVALDKASDVVNSIKDKSRDMVETVCDKATDINKGTLEFVKERPYVALASALIAGWVIAKILL